MAFNELRTTWYGRLCQVPWLVWLTVVAGLFILWVLIYPFNFQGFSDGAWLGNNRIGKLNCLANVILFLPYGVLAAWLGAVVFPKQPIWVILCIVADGFVLSLIAETAQLWLPQRESAVIDLATNTLGVWLGACFGWWGAQWLTNRWNSLRQWFSSRPVARRAFVVFVLMVVIKLAPFDLSPETFYLRMSLYETSDAGWPMSAIVTWYGNPDNDTLFHAAVEELVRVTVSCVLFFVVGVGLTLAVTESTRRHGGRTNPIESILFLGVVLVLVMEFLQWPIRSRRMDASDVVAGLAGVWLGALTGWLISRCQRDKPQLVKE